MSPQTVIYKQLGKVYLLKGEVSDAVETYKKAIRYIISDTSTCMSIRNYASTSYHPGQPIGCIGPTKQ